MIRDKLERIRERAYALWEKAGGGHGDDQTHWHQASHEIDDEDAKLAPPRKATVSRGSGKTAAKRSAPAATSRPSSPPRGANMPAAAEPARAVQTPARRGGMAAPDTAASDPKTAASKPIAPAPKAKSAPPKASGKAPKSPTKAAPPSAPARGTSKASGARASKS